MQNYPKQYLYRRAVHAKLYIDAHYAEPISIMNIAHEAHFSKFHFIRLFKKIYGTPPHHYLTKVRIKNSLIHLIETESVKQTCFLVGFESVTSFTALFKRHFGLTPRAFIQQQKQRNADIKNQPLRFIPNCFAENNGWTKKSNFQEALSL